MAESHPRPDRPAFAVPRPVALTRLCATVVEIVLAFLIGARNPRVQSSQPPATPQPTPSGDLANGARNAAGRLLGTATVIRFPEEFGAGVNPARRS